MDKDNVFTYEPKMKANLELIMDIMRCDCQEIVYMDEKIKVLEKALELACEFNATTTCNGQCKDCLHKEICDNTPKIDFRPIYADYFKTKAKEMMKSE